MSNNRPPAIAIVICIYCIVNSLDLIVTWMHPSQSSLGAAALIIWVTPVILYWFFRTSSEEKTRDRPVLLGLGLLLSFNGMVGSLNVLEHMGLACAIGALLPPYPMNIVWLASSLSWMPAFDWLGGRFFPDYIIVARLLTAALPACYMAHSIQRRTFINP
ncbi:MAG: hypothetical protein JXM72_01760 [Deltaproteobacteria bacterium]|nr:hypothetical protein [Deltaproteobacteria bacterium]